MRTFFVLSALAAGAFLAVPGSPAKAANYCLIEDTSFCGFTSYEQCLQSLAGRGPGFCQIDPTDPGPLPRRTSRKRQ